VGADGSRKAVRLGRMPQRIAEGVKTRVECLVACKLAGCAWDGDTATWVANLSDELAAKLSAVGLVPPRESATLGAFLRSYVSG
jgi:hypothetical protein